MVNPLFEAYELNERLLEIEGEIMCLVAGEEAFEPFDEELSAAVIELISRAGDACRDVSPRVRRARLNALWREFLEQQENKMREMAEGEQKIIYTDGKQGGVLCPVGHRRAAVQS